MILLLVILCTFVFLTAAHPLAQLLLQANPNLLQNGYNNIPNPQFPFQQSKQNVNSYSSPFIGQKPDSNSPCQPNYWAQNPSSWQVKQINSGDRQLFNKILTNPMIQMILDPKSKLYNENGIEVPKQRINLPNTGATPSTINNYYILTPECFHTNEREEIKSTKQTKKQLGNYKLRNNETQNRQRNSEDQIKMNHERKRPGTSANILNQQSRNAKSQILNQNNENPKRSCNVENNNKYRDQKDEIITREHSKNNSSRQTAKKIRNKFENTDRTSKEVIKENSYSDKEILLYQNQNTTQDNSKRRRRKKTKEENKVTLIAEDLPIEQEATEIAADIHIRDDDDNKYENKKPIRIESKSVDSNEIKTEITRHRNSKDEAIIKDIHTKFPGIPEDVIKKLLKYLRRQLRSQRIGDCNLQYTNYDFPLRYDQLFPQFSNLNFKNYKSKDTINRRRNPNSRNHSKRKQPKQVNSEEFEDTKTTKDTMITTDIEPTVSSIQTVITDAQVEDYTPMKKLNDNVDKIDNKESEVVYPTTHFNTRIEKITESTETETSTNMNNLYKFPKLGEEDVINSFPENFIDDYYPDFRADNIYLDSNDNNIRNLRHNRYYYTTDRNDFKQKNRMFLPESTEIHYQPYKSTSTLSNYKDGHNNSAGTVYKVLDVSLENPLDSSEHTNYQMNTPKSLFEELKFKTPPVLENPDFETKPIRPEIERPYYRPELKNSNEDKTYAAKSSTYSIAKQVNIPSKPRTDIETVFAQSKVVKYGHNEDFAKDSFDVNNSKNNNTTLVFAQSIYSDDEY